jgi:hypothetical protein
MILIGNNVIIHFFHCYIVFVVTGCFFVEVVCYFIVNQSAAKNSFFSTNFVTFTFSKILGYFCYNSIFCLHVRI